MCAFIYETQRNVGCFLWFSSKGNWTSSLVNCTFQYRTQNLIQCQFRRRQGASELLVVQNSNTYQRWHLIYHLEQQPGAADSPWTSHTVVRHSNMLPVHTLQSAVWHRWAAIFLWCILVITQRVMEGVLLPIQQHTNISVPRVDQFHTDRALPVISIMTLEIWWIKCGYLYLLLHVWCIITHFTGYSGFWVLLVECLLEKGRLEKYNVVALCIPLFQT